MRFRALLTLAVGSTLCAQPARLEFESASVKPSSPDTRQHGIDTPPGRFRASNTTVQELLRMAYHVYDFQMAKGPGWMETERFDIVAKAVGEPGYAEIQQMVQTLLADRFKLTIHRETRELPVYALLVSKGGTKFHQAAKDFGPEDRLAMAPGGQPGAFKVVAQGVPLTVFASMLPTVLARPVLDMTGLAGKFDFTLEFSPDQMMRPTNASPDTPLPDLAGSSIFTALQEQLGLKLEARKGPVEVLVIDRVERPTSN
jgi:uncharacterized protein (TIGR03435 family)